MISMKKIAEKLEISRCTVSNILNDTRYASSYKLETIEKVRQTARDMGYISNNIAKSLKTGNTRTIAIVVPDIANTFYIRIIKEVERLANAADYSLIICIVEESLEKENCALRMLQSRMVDGILISPTSFRASLQDQYEFKTVCFDRTVKGGKFPSIMIDNQQSAYDLTSKIIESGAKNLLFLSGSQSNNTISCRLKGFKRAMADAAINASQSKVIHGIFDDKTVYKKLEKMILDNDFHYDGVFLSTNFFIYGILEVLNKYNISIRGIGGFDEVSGLALVEQEIFVVDHNEKKIAFEAFNTLQDLILGKEVGNKIVSTNLHKLHTAQ